MPGRRQRRHVLTAAGRVVSGQAAELIKQPPRRKHLEQAVNFPGTDLIRGDHQVEALGGQRYEGQAVGQRLPLNLATETWVTQEVRTPVTLPGPARAHVQKQCLEHSESRHSASLQGISLTWDGNPMARRPIALFPAAQPPKAPREGPTRRRSEDRTTVPAL
jgi:hypothetical protein